jgi:hypothetical protein
MQNAETVLGILRERNTGSHRRAGRSETIISGSGGAVLVLQRQFLVMVDGDHGVGSGRFGLGAGGVAARSTS